MADKILLNSSASCFSFTLLASSAIINSSQYCVSFASFLAIFNLIIKSCFPKFSFASM